MSKKIIVLNGSPRKNGNTSALVEGDVVVLASPLYYWNLSGQLRTAFDRLFAVAECNTDYTNPKKESVLLMAAEGNEFEDCVSYYDHLMGHLG